jgi:hypothetical protein
MKIKSLHHTAWEKRVLICAALGIVFVFADVLRSATYYVSVNGSNSNPGTFAQPFQTIGYAIQ